MTNPTQARRGGRQLTINMNDVINGLHERYGAVIGQLMQENAELLSGFNQQGAELAEAQAKVAALQGSAGVKVVTKPAPTAPSAEA